MQAEQLAQVVVAHQQAYEAGQPVVSDAAWDAMVQKLRALAPAHTALLAVGARVAGGEVHHERPMLSLAKAASRAELVDWMLDYPGAAVLTPKVDGVAVAIRYSASGRLELAATRGDGRVGGDVTAVLLQSGAVPARLVGWSGGAVELRGEVYVRRGAGTQLRARACNLLLGRKVAGMSARDLAFVAWDVCASGWSDSLTARLQRLRDHGIATVPTRAVTATTLPGQLRATAGDRFTWPWESDGAVLVLDSSAAQEAAGANRHHPHGAVAWKWRQP